MTNENCEADVDLVDVQDRLDDLEDRLHVEYPTPDTCAGGAQRVRIEVPSPRSLLTVGARGSGTSEGVPLGPGGIALRTVENLGVEIRGRACVDTDGLTIFHAVDATRVLTQADLGIVSADALRIGTTRKNIELTAGDVAVNDPVFTVDPSMAVPDAPEVNTASPRAGTESQSSAISVVWKALDLASSFGTLRSVFRNGLSRGVTEGVLAAQAASALGALRAAVTAGEILWEACLAAAEAVDLEHDYEPPAEPAVKIHGAGGIALTSPAKFSAYATDAVSLSSPNKVSIAAGWKATIKSGGNAKLYGVASATLASEGAVGIKGRVVSTSGDYTEMKAAKTAAVISTGAVLVQAKTKAVVNAAETSIAGNDVYVSARDEIRAESDFIIADAKTQNNLWSNRTVKVMARRDIEMEVSSTKLKVTDGEVRIDVAGSRVVADRHSVHMFGFRVERNRTRIRGNVDLG